MTPTRLWLFYTATQQSRLEGTSVLTWCVSGEDPSSHRGMDRGDVRGLKVTDNTANSGFYWTPTSMHPRPYAVGHTVPGSPQCF